MIFFKGDSATLTYASPTRLHAVTSATVKGFNRTYSYDAAGYVTSDGKRTYTWTSFGQLQSLEYQGVPELKDFSGNIVHASASTVISLFDFDAAGSRARQVKERISGNDSREIETTLYLGSYEREHHTTKANGTASPVLVKTVHRHSLGGGMIYSRVLGGSDPGTKLTNVLKDHLGSTDAVVVGIWNGSTFASQSIEYQSFDAWGERRDAATQISYRASDTDPFRTSSKDHDRGYTGHEQLDDSGLIHMNGRIFDPELGRFLSPDPIVQVPEYSQNFNRYSYVLNNPLNATDPSGFSFISKAFSKIGSFIKENWRTIVVIAAAVVVTALTAGIAGSVAYSTAFGLASGGASFATSAIVGAIAGFAAAGAVVGAITGALSAGLNGGDLGDVLRGATIQGISGALAGPLHMAGGLANIVGHGIVGGLTNVAMGAKFGDGFISAAAGAATSVSGLTNPETSGLNIVGRTAVASVTGGTASMLGGGKFANGAWTAAFQHLVNAEAETTLISWARSKEYMWSSERKLDVMNHYRSQGLEYTNSSIDELKKAMYATVVPYMLRMRGAVDQKGYESMYANLYQDLEAATYAAATMDPNWKFAPKLNFTVTVGAGLIYGGQIGATVDNSSTKLFIGHGFTTRWIGSFAIGQGDSPALGSKTTSWNLGLKGIGVGYENGGGNFQITLPGASRMKNHYFYEK